MPTLELSDHECEILVELMESAISELGYEINDTDKADYRDALKIKKAIATAIVERIKPR